MAIRQGFAAVVITMGLAAQASAFDEPPPIDAPEIDTGAIAATTDGWYIRGDIGYNASVDSDAPTFRTLDFDNGGYQTQTFDNSRFSNEPTFNIGAGYQFNDFFRADATLDYFTSTFKAKTEGINVNGVTGLTPCGRSLNGANAFCSYRQQDMSALGLLANGYVDLGTYWGLTPYVGAGAGMSYVKWDSVDEQTVNGPAFSSSDLKHEGDDSWRFTYALMAGLSYDVATNIKIDFGYRFSQIDGGDMFSFNQSETDRGAFGAKARDQGLTRHEFRTGIRVVNW